MTAFDAGREDWEEPDDPRVRVAYRLIGAIVAAFSLLGLCAIAAPIFDVISWGDRYTMDWAFWQRYVDEAYALFSPLWIAASGHTPLGLDPATLQEIMQAIRA